VPNEVVEELAAPPLRFLAVRPPECSDPLPCQHRQSLGDLGQAPAWELGARVVIQ
jgi:hypothetical protein